MLQIYINEFSQETPHKRQLMNDFMGPILQRKKQKSAKGCPDNYIICHLMMCLSISVSVSGLI